MLPAFTHALLQFDCKKKSREGRSGRRKLEASCHHVAPKKKIGRKNLFGTRGNRRFGFFGWIATWAPFRADHHPSVHGNNNWELICSIDFNFKTKTHAMRPAISNITLTGANSPGLQIATWRVAFLAVRKK